MAKEKLHIREAGYNDVSRLSSLVRNCYRDVAERFNLTSENCSKHPSNCTQGWIKKDFERGVVYYILERNDMPIGCVAFEKADPDLGYLERLAVLPEHRRNGFGKMLVEHIFDHAKALKMKSLSIGIISEQIELKSWYLTKASKIK